MQFPMLRLLSLSLSLWLASAFGSYWTALVRSLGARLVILWSMQP